MEKAFKKTVWQNYVIHLLNGETVTCSEEYDLPFEKGFIEKIKKADDDTVFTITDLLAGSAYIPKKSILYIHTGDVVEDTRYVSVRKEK